MVGLDWYIQRKVDGLLMHLMTPDVLKASQYLHVTVKITVYMHSYIIRIKMYCMYMYHNQPVNVSAYVPGVFFS